MVGYPNPNGFADTEGLKDALEKYDRCLSYFENDGVITAQSGMHPHYRRFQRDLHGPTVNIQGHGYVVTHVRKRKMLYSELHKDDDFDHLMPEYVEYEDKPECCIVTLKPIVDVIQEGRDGPGVRA